MSCLHLCAAKLGEEAAAAAPAFLLSCPPSFHMQNLEHLKAVICSEPSLQSWPVVLGSWVGQGEVRFSDVVWL